MVQEVWRARKGERTTPGESLIQTVAVVVLSKQNSRINGQPTSTQQNLHQQPIDRWWPRNVLLDNHRNVCPSNTVRHKDTIMVESTYISSPHHKLQKARESECFVGDSSTSLPEWGRVVCLLTFGCSFQPSSLRSLMGRQSAVERRACYSSAARRSATR